MKRYIITLIMAITAWQAANAMSYEQARQEALYLTDKMAYELNLNDQQYNDAYEINLDYFLSLNSEADLYEDYLSYRLSDLRHILYDWQYSLMMAADYFIRPVYWRSSGWYFSIYNHYNHGYFYYSYPTVYYSYRGGHGRIHYNHGFYADRRPAWNGGLRGNQPIGGRNGRDGRSNAFNDRTGRVHGNGYHFDLSRKGNDRSDRGNSFSNSSSRNPRNDYSRRDGSIGRSGNNGSENYSRQSNPGISNRSSDGSRNSGSSRTYENSRNSDYRNGFTSPRSTGSNNGFSSPRSSGMSNRNYSGSPSSGSRSGNFGNSHSSGSRSGNFGNSPSSGSRGGSFGSGGRGSVSRGRR